MTTITRKTLLYKSGVEYADYSLNHVEGCSHGCKYPCYAYLMKKRCGIVKTYDDWRKPKIVANALELLNNEIVKYKNKIDNVHLCFSTDPFMYRQTEIGDLSMEIIGVINKYNIRCNILTKGIYPSALSNASVFNRKNEYGITLVSLDESFRENYEPYASPFKERMAALKVLHSKGCTTWVSIEPYPTPNMIEQNLQKILESVSFVDKIIFGRLNYNTISAGFKYNKEFYSRCVKLVIKFCKKNKISYYIKKGT